MKLCGLLVSSAGVLLALASCSPDRTALTQVMVVVDSDLRSIDSVRVRVDGMSEPKEATASDLDRRPLPRSVAVVHDGGPMGPIVITAEGLSGEQVVVKQRARLSFVQGRNMMLRLELAASCVGTTCIGREETCVEGTCTSFRVDEGDLDDWPGSLPRDDRDAGEDGDAGMPSAGRGAGTGGSSGRGGASGGRAGASGAGTGGSSGMSGGTGGAGSPAAGSGGSPPPTCDDCTFDVSAAAARGTLTCEAGNVCRLRCNSGYADDDGERSNGCETAAIAFDWTPSNFDPTAPTWTPAIAEELRVNCDATVDFGSAALSPTVDICGQSIQPMLLAQANGGPEVVVLAARHFSVAAGTKLRFTGSRPVLVAVYGDAEIEGEVDVSAIGTTGAAGSNYACGAGVGAAGQNGEPGAGGGGGGGFGTAGGKGGVAAVGDGGLGGGASSQAQLRPLRGGCAGARGGTDDGKPGLGGASGGAFQLSATGTLRVSGVIAAAGGGGARAADGGDGGGGGGSGGAILLEATRLEVQSSAWITANGGGGGAGRYSSLGNPVNGSDGAHASAVAAPGGSGNGPGGDGAAGATQAKNAPPGYEGDAPYCGGGGGGGGLGRIVLHASDCQIAGNTSPAVICSAHP